MDTLPGLLAAILSQKSESEAEVYETFAGRITAAVEAGELCARHGSEHWRNVGLLAARMIPERVVQQMASAEVLILAVAAVAHDLQAPGRDGFDWLTDDPARWGLDTAVAGTVRLICDHLQTGGRRPRRTPRWGYCGRASVDIQRLAAALLVADRLDLQHTDVPPPPTATDLAPEARARWPQERGLSVGLIDPREGVLRLDLTESNKTWAREIEEHFLPEANRALAAGRNVLLASGIPFREIELQDLHAKPSADVARAQEIMKARAGARRRPAKPFKSLDPYEEDEFHLLAARDEEILKLTGRVLTSPLTVLMGEVGVGKTSLVAAGVLPWLREHGHDGVLARCLNDPTQSLLDACHRRLGRSLIDGGQEELREAIAALAETAEGPIVLALDQCQELFTRLGSRTRQEFAKDLAGLLAMPGDRVHVLLVVQREFFTHLVEFLPVLPTLFHEVMELRRLSPEQCKTVIRRALGRFRLRFDGLVTSHVIDELATEIGVLPVELQLVCDTLCANAEEDEYRLGYDVYRRVGPARRILETFIDSRLRSLRWRRGALAKGLLVNCVTAQRTKALVSADECAVDLGCDLATTREVLDELVGLGLLRQMEMSGRPVYELRHEYLALRLEASISDMEREAKDVDDLLHRELNNYQKFQLLLDTEKLKLIHHYRRRLTFTPEELELLIRSAAQSRFEIDYWFSRVSELAVSQQMVLAVDLLYSPEPDLRDALKAMISRLDHQAVLPTLLDSLREADVGIRETAIDILKEIDDNLVRALLQGDTTTQREAAYALGQIGARHAVGPLVETAQHGTAEVREQAVEALAEIDRSRSADMLLRSLHTGSSESRWNAAAALGRLGRDQEIRERIRREAERREAGSELLFAYAVACLEGRQFDEAERLLGVLAKRAIPTAQQPRVEAAEEQLAALRKQEARGLFTWPMHRGNAGGSAYTAQALRLPLELKWEFATRDRVYSSPAVADGTVYVGSTDHRLYALDAESGAERWVYDAGAEIRSSPCVLGGRIYFGDLAGGLHAVDQDTGSPIWRQRVGAPVASSVRGRGGRLFVGADDGSLLAFEPEAGRTLWRARLAGPVEASPATDGERVAVGTAESGLVVFDAVDGEPLWQWRVDGGLKGSPAMANGHLVVGGGDGRIDLLTADGTLLWSAFLKSPVNSSAAVAHGRVYCSGLESEIAAFEIATGRLVWSFEAEGEMSASPTISGKTVFCGSQAGQLYALRADTGELLWRYSTGYSIHSTPAVADGRLFVALRYYNMCAFAEPVDVEDIPR